MLAPNFQFLLFCSWIIDAAVDYYNCCWFSSCVDYHCGRSHLLSEEKEKTQTRFYMRANH